MATAMGRPILGMFGFGSKKSTCPAVEPNACLLHLAPTLSLIKGIKRHSGGYRIAASFDVCSTEA